MATRPLTPRGAPPVARRRAVPQKAWAPYIFLLPALLFFVVFFLLPILFSLYLTFTNWNALSPPRWVGGLNYRFLLTQDPAFYTTLRNTLVFAFGTVLVGIPIALGFAFLFTRSRYKAFWRSLYWLPMITNVVAIAYLWQFILDGRFGLFNRVLGWFGVVGPNWLTTPGFDMVAVIIVAVWAGLGQNMVLFSAGLEGIDGSYYDAAQTDGAGLWASFWHVTLPLLRPTLLFVTITSFIAGMGSFALILVLTNGNASPTTNVTALYMYQMAFQDLRLGRASAASFLLFVIIFIFTLLQLRLFRRGGVEAY